MLDTCETCRRVKWANMTCPGCNPPPKVVKVEPLEKKDPRTASSELSPQRTAKRLLEDL